MPTPAKANPRRSRGQRAERAVQDDLVAKGFAILFANLHVGRLELDLVARKGPLVVVVEVRTRGPGSFATAFESVTRAKRVRLLEATDRLWRTELSKLAGVERVRIDVAAVRLDGEGAHIDYAEGAIVGGDGAF